MTLRPPRQGRSFAGAVAAGLALLACIGPPAAAAGAPLRNVARPVWRADFENRIWQLRSGALALGPSARQLVSTVRLPAGKALAHRAGACPPHAPCEQNVFIAGTAYLQGASGEREVVLAAPTAQGIRHFAVLPAYVQSDALVDAVLAVFEPGQAMPVCQVPLLAPRGRYEYGVWRARGVFRLPEGRSLAWVESSGGDGGYSWFLELFVELAPDCQVGRTTTHFLSMYPDDRCTQRPPDIRTLYTVHPGGEVKMRRPRPSCLNFAQSNATGIRIGP